jgi:hypothetical protein
MEIFQIVNFCYYLLTFLAYKKVQTFENHHAVYFPTIWTVKTVDQIPKLVERVTTRNHQKATLFKLIYRAFRNVLRDYKNLWQENIWIYIYETCTDRRNKHFFQESCFSS